MAARVRLRTERFREVAQAKGLRLQAEQAAVIGIHEATLGRILTGKSAMSQGAIAGILAAFPDLSFTDLFEVTFSSAVAS